MVLMSNSKSEDRMTNFDGIVITKKDGSEQVIPKNNKSKQRLL